MDTDPLIKYEAETPAESGPLALPIQQPVYPTQPDYNESQNGTPAPYGFILAPAIYRTKPGAAPSSSYPHFTRAVYLFVGAQLLITVAIIILFVFIDGLKQYTLANPAFAVCTWAGFTIICFLPCCFGKTLARPIPMLIWQLILALAAGVFLGVLCTKCSVEEVLTALGSTALLSLGSTLIAFKVKWDFARLNNTLFFVVFMVVVVFAIFTGGLRRHFPVARWLFAGIAVMVPAIGLICDTLALRILSRGMADVSLPKQEEPDSPLSLYSFYTIPVNEEKPKPVVVEGGEPAYRAKSPQFKFGIYIDIFFIFLFMLDFF